MSTSRGKAAVAVITVAALALFAARPIHAGVLEVNGGAASIALPASPLPGALSGTADHAVFAWVRRTSAAAPTEAILALGSALRVSFDDAAPGVRFELDDGAGGSATALVPLDDAAPGPQVPVGEWMLLACAWDATTRSLDAWAQSETAERGHASAVPPTWADPPFWPVTYGAGSGAPAFTGHLGLVAVRKHTVGTSELDLVWNGGAPAYHGSVYATGGAMNGFPGVAFLTGHAVTTSPLLVNHAGGVGAQLGDAVTPDNLIVYHGGGVLDWYSVRALTGVTGTWTFRSPHETGAPWSGFFARAIPDLGLAGDPWTAQVAPTSRALADGAANGLTRVIVSGNSRGVRNNTAFYDGGFENWAFGGLYRARKDLVAGVVVPAWTTFRGWPGFFASGRIEGTVRGSFETTAPSVAFAGYGSHGQDNPAFPGYFVAGNALVIEDGSAWIPKARPEPGTRFDDASDPLTVRAMCLRFPGAGSVEHIGEKATSQGSAGTREGSTTAVDLDTTVVSHALGEGDALDAGARTVTIVGPVPGVAAGDGCFVASGPAAGAIATVTDVSSGGGLTTITLERWFPVDPVVGTSTLAFGPVEPVWVEHAWAGLAPGETETYRGVRLTASGGLVVVLFVECVDPGEDGYVVGAAGTAGRGYGVQLDLLETTGGVRFMQGLAPDVWLQFFAHQSSPVTSMADYADAVRAAAPGVELWWCGDPDLDAADLDDVDGTDAWQTWILDNAAAHDVGAIVAQTHPSVGTGSERCADGQVADQPHVTARGCEIYLDAVLDLMTTAAEFVPCPADLTGDGGVGFEDLNALLMSWGACPACPADLNGDGSVGFFDLNVLLAAWGPCG